MTIRAPFRSRQRVYFDDLDALQLLHNVRFVLFMERARGEMFHALGFRWNDAPEDNPDRWHVVAEHQVRYLVPFRGEGEVEVEIRPTHLGRSSLVLAARVRDLHGETVYADGTTRLVRIDPQSWRPCSWSPRFRAAMAPLLPQSPPSSGG
ncbi:MAG: acyl-CoA thioesterase [Myxococcota bacterium]|nr:acyl-CoA thioesterase [Myxococcota bacterium]MDW8363735.1 thioesterase family protein [Myxococcales bacterium]